MRCVNHVQLVSTNLVQHQVPNVNNVNLILLQLRWGPWTDQTVIYVSMRGPHAALPILYANMIAPHAAFTEKSLLNIVKHVRLVIKARSKVRCQLYLPSAPFHVSQRIHGLQLEWTVK